MPDQKSKSLEAATLIVSILSLIATGCLSLWLLNRTQQFEQRKVAYELKTKFCFDLMENVSSAAQLSKEMAQKTSEGGASVDRSREKREIRFVKLNESMFGSLKFFDDAELTMAVKAFVDIPRESSADKYGSERLEDQGSKVSSACRKFVDKVHG